MVDFSTLTPENINMFAMKHYDNPTCVDEKEFLENKNETKTFNKLKITHYFQSYSKLLMKSLGIQPVEKM